MIFEPRNTYSEENTRSKLKFIKASLVVALINPFSISDANALAFTTVGYDFSITINDAFNTMGPLGSMENLKIVAGATFPGGSLGSTIKNNGFLTSNIDPATESPVELGEGDSFSGSASIEARADEKNDKTASVDFGAFGLQDLYFQISNLSGVETYYVNFTLAYNVRSASSVQDGRYEGARSGFYVDVSGDFSDLFAPDHSLFVSSSTGRSYMGSPAVDEISGTLDFSRFVEPDSIFGGGFSFYEADGFVFSVPEPSTLWLATALLIGANRRSLRTPNRLL